MAGIHSVFEKISPRQAPFQQPNLRPKCPPSCFPFSDRGSYWTWHFRLAFSWRNFMVSLHINGQSRDVEVSPDTPLLWALRDVLGLTGTKFGCGIAQCGACTIHLDGRPVRSCMLAVGTIGDRKITTIEAVGDTPAGAKIQKAWLDLEVVQCGYCQSGQIMSATALLATIPNPSDADIDAAMAGNICRCGTYVRIRSAIKLAAQKAHGHAHATAAGEA